MSNENNLGCLGTSITFIMGILFISCFLIVMNWIVDPAATEESISSWSWIFPEKDIYDKDVFSKEYIKMKEKEEEHNLLIVTSYPGDKHRKATERVLEKELYEATREYEERDKVVIGKDTVGGFNVILAIFSCIFGLVLGFKSLFRSAFMSFVPNIVYIVLSYLCFSFMSFTLNFTSGPSLNFFSIGYMFLLLILSWKVRGTD